MESEERRRSPRRDSINLIDFVVLGPDGSPVSRRMGRTLNVSEHGFLLESLIPIDVGEDVIVNLALGEDLLELRGQVAHVITLTDEKFQVGIEMKGLRDKDRNLLRQYLRDAES